MSYYTVLWYSNNPVLMDYSERYFTKLITLFTNISQYEDFKKDFLQLSKNDQKEFLLHPDISSLLIDISINKTQLSLDTLEKEFRNFLSWDSKSCTFSLWMNIGGTHIKLTDLDNNPTGSELAHPGHDQNGMVWWWERPEKEWLWVFSKVFEVLADVDREFFDELNFIIQKVVPMKTSLDVHNSCSHQGCIGTIYLGYTINSKQPEINILEALIHESSHNKLNLIMQIEPLILNNYDLKYYSPYRPDARHMRWVFLWVHAIIPTVYVMLSAIEKWYVTDGMWYEKVLLYHVKNKLWYRVLQKYAEFTPIGRQVFEDMWEVMKLCDIKIKQSTLLQGLDFWNIQSRAKQHFMEVQENYSHLQY